MLITSSPKPRRHPTIPLLLKNRRHPKIRRGRSIRPN
jgi:hypothetical protein